MSMCNKYSNFLIIFITFFSYLMNILCNNERTFFFSLNFELYSQTFLIPPSFAHFFALEDYYENVCVSRFILQLNTESCIIPERIILPVCTLFYILREVVWMFKHLMEKKIEKLFGKGNENS